MSQSKSQGFSLIELVAVIVIVGILATMTTRIITLPVQGYLDLQRRTTLVDTAELALRRMQRDIRRALPNSVRITGGGQVLELLHIVDAGRYRAQQAPSGASVGCGSLTADVLNFTATDNCFEVTGSLGIFKPMEIATPVAESLVVYNLGSGTADAYAGSNRTTVVNSGDARVISFNSLRFPFSSPQQRFYIVDTPITYRCASNQLLRYSNYTITAAQPNPPSVVGQIQALANIMSCQFTYSPGTASRAGLVTLTITLTDADGESAQLMHQVHVDNMP